MKFYDTLGDGVAEALADDAEALGISVDIEDVREVLDQVNAMEGGPRVRISMVLGAIVLLYEDGGDYYLSAPIPLADGLDGEAIYNEMADFTRRELIPFTLVDVPREELELITDTFAHIDAECTDDDDDVFVVNILNEVRMLREHPTFEDARLSMDALRDEDAEIYLSLLSDTEVNRYWGYDYRDDDPDATGLDLINETRSEYRRGASLTFAVRYDGYLIGEAVMYDFDYKGGCEIAIRILGYLHQCGIGSETLLALYEIGKNMGLSVLRSSVDQRNAKSLKMCRKFMTELPDLGDGRVRFEKRLVDRPHSPMDLI